MDYIYTAISWILLRWHSMWDAILPDRTFLATNWDWILAIIFLVVTVRVILFPLFVKQIKSQRAMQTLAPQIKELQEKHKGDRETLQKEMMELYRKEKANPLMGCLPMVLQVPVFFSLFHTLKRLNPARTDANTTLYSWSYEKFHDASVARLFNAPIADTFASGSGTSKVVAGLLVVIMIITTFLPSRQMILKTGWSEDPTQKMMQKLMLYGIPASLLFSGYLFPIGVVIYWVVQNLFSMGQQFWVLKKFPPPKMPAKKGAVTGRGPAATTAGKTDARKPGRKSPGIGRVSKDAAARMNEAREQTAVAQKALAPKPGAKPVKPKKGGAARAKRPAG